MVEALGAESLCHAFQITAAAHADRVALRSHDDAVSITWKGYADRVRSVAAGLASLGVGEGDTVAMLLANRHEFSLLDTGALHLGAVPFSLYHTNPPELIATILRNSQSKVVVTEPAYLERVLQTRERYGLIERVVVAAGSGGDLTFEEMEGGGDPAFDFEGTWRRVGGDHVATLVYTSGTTGEPKGVEHLHRGLLWHVGAMNKLWPVSPGGRVVSYLPMAHIAERYISHYTSFASGYTITCCPNPSELSAALVSTRPTRLFGVPRIYEKLRAGVLGMAEGDAALGEAIEAGSARVRAEQAGSDVPVVSPEHEALYAGVREKLGLDQLEWSGVAAAPTPYVVLEFFHAIGVRVAELWGMSECCLAVTNPPDRIKLGTVGKPVPGVEVKLADDGEILLRSPGNMRSYRNAPEKTAEAFDAARFLRTGDIAVADEDGYLKIVDRKKELIINSAGKNMSPAHIESVVKEESPLIAQVVAIGDARKYVTALIVLDEDGAQGAAERYGITGGIVAVAASAEVRAEIEGAVARGNERLARVEQIKTFTVLPTAWVPGGDELTPTMKLKRRVINTKYATQIAELYAEA
jgi:long-subunit acyl-CoA synthetase (AMP-forming)